MYAKRKYNINMIRRTSTIIQLVIATFANNWTQTVATSCLFEPVTQLAAASKECILTITAEARILSSRSAADGDAEARVQVALFFNQSFGCGADGAPSLPLLFEGDTGNHPQQLKQYFGPRFGVGVTLETVSEKQDLIFKTRLPCSESTIPLCSDFLSWHMRPVGSSTRFPAASGFHFWRSSLDKSPTAISNNSEVCVLWDECSACGALPDLTLLNLSCANGSVFSFSLAQTGDCLIVESKTKTRISLWPTFDWPSALSGLPAPIALSLDSFAGHAFFLFGTQGRGWNALESNLPARPDTKSWKAFRAPEENATCCGSTWDSTQWQLLEINAHELDYNISDLKPQEWCKLSDVCAKLLQTRNFARTSDSSVLAVIPSALRNESSKGRAFVTPPGAGTVVSNQLKTRAFSAAGCLFGLVTRAQSLRQEQFVAAGVRCRTKSVIDPFRKLQLKAPFLDPRSTTSNNGKSRCVFRAGANTNRETIKHNTQCHIHDNPSIELQIDALSISKAKVLSRSSPPAPVPKKDLTCASFPWSWVAEGTTNKTQIRRDAAALGCSVLAILLPPPHSLQNVTARVATEAETWEITPCLRYYEDDRLLIGSARCDAAAPPLHCKPCPGGFRLRCDGFCVPKSAPSCPPGMQLTSNGTACVQCDLLEMNDQWDGACRPCLESLPSEADNKSITCSTDTSLQQRRLEDNDNQGDSVDSTENYDWDEESNELNNPSVHLYVNLDDSSLSSGSFTDDETDDGSDDDDAAVVFSGRWIPALSPEPMIADFSMSATASEIEFACSQSRLQPWCPASLERLPRGRHMALQGLRLPLPSGSLSQPIDAVLNVFGHRGRGTLGSHLTFNSPAFDEVTFRGPDFLRESFPGTGRMQLLYRVPSEMTYARDDNRVLLGNIYLLNNFESQSLMTFQILWDASERRMSVDTLLDTPRPLSQIIQTILRSVLRNRPPQDLPFIGTSHIALPALTPGNDVPFSAIIRFHRTEGRIEEIWDFRRWQIGNINFPITYGAPIDLSMTWPSDRPLPRDIFPPSLTAALGFAFMPGALSICIHLEAQSWSIEPGGIVNVLAFARPRLKVFRTLAAAIGFDYSRAELPRFWESSAAHPFLVHLRFEQRNPTLLEYEFINDRIDLLSDHGVRDLIPDPQFWSWIPSQAAFILDSSWRNANIAAPANSIRHLLTHICAAPGANYATRLMPFREGLIAIIMGPISPSRSPFPNDDRDAIPYGSGSRILYIETQSSISTSSQGFLLPELPDDGAGGFILRLDNTLVAFSLNPDDGQAASWRQYGLALERLTQLREGNVLLSAPRGLTLPPPPHDLSRSGPDQTIGPSLPSGDLARNPMRALSPRARAHAYTSTDNNQIASEFNWSPFGDSERWRDQLEEPLRRLVNVGDHGRISISNEASKDERGLINAAYAALFDPQHIQHEPPHQTALVAAVEIAVDETSSEERASPNTWTLAIHAFTLETQLDAGSSSQADQPEPAPGFLPELASLDISSPTATAPAEPCRPCTSLSGACASSPCQGRAGQRMRQVTSQFRGLQNTITGRGIPVPIGHVHT